MRTAKVWEEIKKRGVFQDEPSQLERFIAEQRDKLNCQSEQINLLKEKIAELEKGKSDMAQRELTITEKVYGVETTDFDNPVLPLENSEISETQTNKARSIALDDVRFMFGEGLKFHTIRALNAAGMKTLGDVADRTFDELLRIKFIGKAAMNTISSVLRSHGLTLKDEISAYLKPIVKLKRKGKTVTEIAKELKIPTSLVTKYLQFVKPDLKNPKGGG